MSKEFPKTIYIYNEKDADGTTIHYAQDTINDIEDGEKVGIYELKQVRTMTVTEELK